MKSLHSICVKARHDVTIEIEWPEGVPGNEIEINGHQFPCGGQIETADDKLGELGIPAIAWREQEEELLFERLQLRENTDYLVDVVLPMSRRQAEIMWREDRSWPLPQLRTVYVSDPPRRWTSVGGGLRVTGRLNFGAYAGVVEFRPVDSRGVRFEVVCAKLGYARDYRVLLSEIAEELTLLLFDVGSPTWLPLAASSGRNEDDLISLFILRSLMDGGRLTSAARTIVRSPKSLVEHPQMMDRMECIGRVRPDQLVQNLRQCDFVFGGPFSHLFSGFSPRTAPNLTGRVTLDTPENRYVKAFLTTLVHTLERLRGRLGRRKRFVSVFEIDRWIEAVNEVLGLSFWRDVGQMTHFPSNSQILFRAPGYRDILRADLQLQVAVDLPWRSPFPADGLFADTRRISTLYEFWCFLTLRSVLRQICGPETGGERPIIGRTRDGLTFELRKGHESRCVFTYTRGDIQALVTLFYNRKFTRSESQTGRWLGSYSTDLNPDFSISICTGRARTHWLHFDAKYRLDFKAWREAILNAGTDDNAEGEAVPKGYKSEDLFKMHTYRDALFGSRGSFVLFPGSRHTEEVFIRYPGVEYERSGVEMPAVGAFQLRPRRDNSQRHCLSRFLEHCLDLLCTRENYVEELGLRRPASAQDREIPSS